MCTLCLEIDSDLRQVALVHTCVRALCELAPLSVDHATDIQLGVAEWLNNVIQHGYANQPGQCVRVDARLCADRVEIEIHDWGREVAADVWQEAGQAPASSVSALSALPESGHGLYLIKTCLDRVEYRTQDGRHTLILSKFYPPQPA